MASPTDLYPLHPNQLDLFLDQCLHPASPHYNLGGYISLIGDLKLPSCLEASRLLRQHSDAARIALDL